MLNMAQALDIRSRLRRMSAKETNMAELWEKWMNVAQLCHVRQITLKWHIEANREC